MTRAEAARLGGIARLGFQALVAKRFGGDRRHALDWLVAKGLAALDADFPPPAAEVLRPRTDATGRSRRPGRPGVTVLIHRTGPWPGGSHSPARRSGDGAGDAARTRRSQEANTGPTESRN